MNFEKTFETWRINAGALKNELENLYGNREEIESRFSKAIKFGTAGLRGIVGAGTNRMNIYTVGQASQAVSLWILSNTSRPKIAIAYDTRKDSFEFAKRAAEVFAGNRIQVKLFPAVTPTPVLAYYVRNYKCDAGIVITASHNPSNYNGFKVYESDGGQLRIKAAKEIEKFMLEMDIFSDVKLMSLEDAQACGLFSFMSKKLKQDYIKKTIALQNEKIIREADLSIVYTPLNGTGAEYVPNILREVGVDKLYQIEEQMIADGSFSTCPYPNPESEQALKLGLKKCEEISPDLFIATDPDADRVRIGVKKDGEIKLLSGNQMGVLLFDYLAMWAKRKGALPSSPICIRTVVSSPMIDKVAEYYGISTEIVLTGFKNVAARLENLEKKGEFSRFVFAYEESIGYLPNPKVWDKDGISTSLIFTEMCAHYKLQGKTILNKLEELYGMFGFYIDETKSYVFDGSNGSEKMQKIMLHLAQCPLEDFKSIDIIKRVDYNKKDSLLKSNLLEFNSKDGTKILVRPSGTEPKLKVYVMAIGASESKCRKIIKRAIQLLDNIII